MIIMICMICDQSLKQKGALLFSPPSKLYQQEDVVIKYHICANCFDPVYEKLLELKQETLKNVK